MSVNINREVQDAFYRYKMPRLQSKIEGKGNGIKTVVTNMEDVARALSRPSAYSTKFFGCELGAQTIMDPAASRYIVNGAHETQRLVELLDVFIKKFVLCAACSNPETVMFIDKKGIVMLDCKACGNQGKVDNNHKLITFILKNPPAANAAAAASAGAKKKTKEERRKEKAARNVGSTSRRASDEEDDEDGAADGPTADAKATNDTAAAPAPAAAEKAGDEDDDESGLQFTPALEINGEGSDPTLTAASPVANRDAPADEEFSADVLAAADAMRQTNLASMNESIRRLIAGEAAAPSSTQSTPEKSGANAASAFADAAGKATDGAELRQQAERLKLREDRAAAVAVQVWFADALTSELPKRAAILAQFVKGTKMQLGVLGGIERLVSQKADWFKELPRALKYLYDKDVLEEENILQWADITSSDYVKADVAVQIREAAKPFLDWLRNAEEESE